MFCEIMFVFFVFFVPANVFSSIIAKQDAKMCVSPRFQSHQMQKTSVVTVFCAYFHLKITSPWSPAQKCGCSLHHPQILVVSGPGLPPSGICWIFFRVDLIHKKGGFHKKKTSKIWANWCKLTIHWPESGHFWGHDFPYCSMILHDSMRSKHEAVKKANMWLVLRPQGPRNGRALCWSHNKKH